jgi:hypothetical protein
LIATRPALNWDHYRCNVGKNITPKSVGLALASHAVMQQSSRLQG